MKSFYKTLVKYLYFKTFYLINSDICCIINLSKSEVIVYAKKKNHRNVDNYRHLVVNLMIYNFNCIQIYIQTCHEFEQKKPGLIIEILHN